MKKRRIEMTLNEMVKMQLNQELRINERGTRVSRVPGGWIYFQDSSEDPTLATFVPLPACVEPVKDVDY